MASANRATAFLSLILGTSILWSPASVPADENSGTAAEPAASFIGYEAPGGEAYFAISLKAAAGQPRAPHDHVILVDTSASQAGSFRAHALELIEALLAALPDDDRVRILACDSELKPLSSDFFPPRSDQVRQAVVQLRRRVPLGATALLPALQRAADYPSDRPQSIIYIGDGMSTGGLVEPDDLRPLVDELRKRRVAVHSFCLGPRTDLQLPGLLAVHTGGVVFVDELIDDAKQPVEKLGRRLAEAADAAVIFPDSVRLEPVGAQLLPASVPPLRGDRETILLGKGDPAQLRRIEVAAEGRPLTWTITGKSGRPGNAFLSALWNLAERSEGLCVSVAGAELLNVARQEYEDHVEQLVARGQRAIAARDLRQAEEIARTVREIDPANVEAETILTASQQVKAVRTKLAHLQQEGAAAAPPEPAEPGTVKQEDLTEQYKDAMRIRTERLTKEVNQTIEAARKTAPQDPDTAIGGLKRVLNTVVSASDIDPVDQQTLRRRTQNAIDEIASLKQRIDLDRLEAQRRRSAVQARRFASDELIQKQEELEQLIDKVRSLLSEGFTGNEAAFEQAEAVARAAWERAPYLGVTAAAVFDSEAAGQLDKVERLRYARSDKFLETLGLVEKAHIPFPDEPPILWPAPEVWRDLTARRKKWASVDLTRYNKAEQKIRAALEKPTEVSFNEQPLEDAINYLKEYHSLDIWIDRQALLDEGVALDQPVNLQLSGATFRSVLKLLLEPLQLTWIIEDEVMKITTAQRASEKLTTRVYPVADLVIPVTSMMSAGIGMGMGGVGGGIGMGGGAMGGGQFGMGGGMGGGGMGMGGMGMFSVADDAVQAPPAEFNNSTVRDRKKKREATR